MPRAGNKRDLKRKAALPDDSEQSTVNDVENIQPTCDTTKVTAVEPAMLFGKDYSDDFRAKVVGGHRLTHVRPQFTENNQLMVPDEHRVLFFSTSTKEITHALSPAAEGDSIANVCLHPFLSYFQVFAFASSGNVHLCNYLDGTATASIQVPLLGSGSDVDMSQRRTVVWGTCRSYPQSMEENYLVIFYAVRVFDTSDQSVWYELYSCPFNQPSENRFLLQSNIFSEQRITFGPQNQYLVFIERSRCFMLMLDHGVPSAAAPEPILLFRRKNKTQFRHYNGIACSPTEHLLVNSDEGGQIYLHHLNPDAPSEKHPKSLLHWHPMAVCDMCFSTNGTYLYSVGSEGVVVRWTLSTLQRNFCARVGYGIRFVVANGSDVAITLQNNIIRLITSHFSDLEGELSTLMYYENQKFTSGLVYNSKVKAIALNGRPGFVQFFNPLQPGQLQVLDVTQSNYIEPIGGVDKVFNIDVHQVACSIDGLWLATFELRDDERNLPEMRLKFWRFNKRLHKAHNHLAKFETHTTIHLPHKERIVQMKFASTARLFVTTGLDQQFKLWTQAVGNEKWYCLQSVLLNASLRPICVDFSSDSSALSVAYDRTVTIWNLNNPKELSLIDSIVYSSQPQQKVLGVHFGSKLCAHLLWLVTDQNVMLWELPKMRCVWTWSVEKHSILKHTFESSSNSLVLLTSSEQITVLSMSSVDASSVGSVRLNGNITADQIESLILFPHTCNESADPLFGRFLLCFLSNSKQMIAFESQHSKCIHSKVKTIGLADNETTAKSDSPFNFLDTLIRRKQGDLSGSISKADPIKYAFSQLNTAKLIDEMFYNVPSHVLPPIEMMSKTFLQSLQIGGIPLEGDQMIVEKSLQIVRNSF
jgi:WD40 repeat protein